MSDRSPRTDLRVLRDRKSEWAIFKATVCPHCGAVSVYRSFDGTKAYCWQGHEYPNVRSEA